LSPLVKGLLPLLFAGSLAASGPEFESNIGQAQSKYIYLARQGSTRAFFEDRAVTFSPHSDARVTLSWVDAAPSGWSITEPSGNLTHYCNQQSVELCREAVPGYRRVTKRGLYPAIDWSMYGTGDNFEYDLIVHPGGNLENAHFRVEGAAARLEGDGVLRAGDVWQWKPSAWQWVDGKKTEVRATLESRGDGEFGFSAGPYREDLDLIVDPVIQAIAVVGGSDDDAVAGTFTTTNCSTQYGVTLSAGWSQIPTSGHSVFVRFSAPQGGGTQTFFWGGAGDTQVGGAAGGCGGFYLVGWTSAQDAPLLQQPYSSAVPQRYAGGATDGYFLSFSNETLVAATYLGGPGSDRIYDIRPTVTQGTAGAPFLLVGETDNSAWPGATIQQIGPGGQTDAFAATWNGTQLSLTVIGGSGNDRAMRLRAVDGANWVIGGESDSPDFPVTSGSPAAAGKDLWLGRIAYDFSTVSVLRLFGGSGDEQFGGVAAIPGRGLYLAGTTTSTDLPAAGNTFAGGATDGFIAAFDPVTAAPAAASYIGGSGRDEIHAMETDGFDLMLGGATDSPDLSLPGLAAGQNVLGGLDGLFVLSDAYASPSRGIRFGGSGDDVVLGIEPATPNFGSTAMGQVYLSGGSRSQDWVHSLDGLATGLGGQDGFEVSVAFADLRLTAFGGSINGSSSIISGDPYIGRNLQMTVRVDAVSEPGMDGVAIVRSSDPSRLLVAADSTLPGTDRIAFSSVDNPNGAFFTMQALSDTGVVDVIVEGRAATEPNGLYPRHVLRVHLAPSALFAVSPAKVSVAPENNASVEFFQAPMLPDGMSGPPQIARPGLTDMPAATSSDNSGLPITSQDNLSGLAFRINIKAVNTGDYTLVPATSLFAAAPGQNFQIHVAPGAQNAASVFGGGNFVVARDNAAELTLSGAASDSLTFTSSDPSVLAVGAVYDATAASFTIPAGSNLGGVWLNGIGLGTVTLSVTGIYRGQPVSETAQVAVVPYRLSFSNFATVVAVGVTAYSSLTLSPQAPSSMSSWTSLPETPQPALITQLQLQSSDSSVATVLTQINQYGLIQSLTYKVTGVSPGSVILRFPQPAPASAANIVFNIKVIPNTIDFGVSTIRIPTGARVTLYPASNNAPTSALKAVRLRVAPGIVSIATNNGSGTDVTVDYSNGQYAASLSASGGAAGQQATLYVSAPGVPEYPIPIHLTDPVFVPTAGEVDLAQGQPYIFTPYFQLEAYDQGQAYPIGLNVQLDQMPPLTPSITPAGICTVPSTVTNGGGGAFNIPLTCTGTGSATVGVIAGAGVSSAQPQYTVKVVSHPPAPPAFPLGASVLTGYGLQTQFNVLSYSSPSFAGTITSSDPSRVLLSLDRNAPGSASVTIPSDRSVGTVYVQGYGSDGVVMLSAQANDGTTGQVTVYLFPSTIAVRPVPQYSNDPTPLLSLSQPASQSNIAAQALPYAVDPASQKLISIYGLSIRGGRDPVFIHAQSSDNSVVQPVAPDPILSESDVSEKLSFKVNAPGDVALTVSQPDGFIAVPDSALKVHIYEQALALSPPPVLSANLETQVSIVGANASTYSQVGTVTATSADPAKLLLGATSTAPGQPSVTVPLNGSLFLQAMDGVQPGDSVNVHLQAAGFSDSQSAVIFAAAQLINASSAPFQLQPLGNYTLTLNYGPINTFFGVSTNVTVRPGVQQTLQVATSDSTVLALPQTSIPFNTNMSIPLRPLAPGHAQLQVQAPPGINNTTPNIDVTVLPFQFNSIQVDYPTRYFVSKFAVTNPLGQPLPIAITSNNGAPLLLGTAASGAGTPSSASLTATLNSNETRTFYLEPRGAGNSVQLQISAANFATANPSAPVSDPLVKFAQNSPLGMNLKTGPVTITVGLYGSYPTNPLPLGTSYGPLNIQVQSSNPAVVTAPASVSFGPGDSVKSIQLTPVAAGQAIVSLIIPSSFAGSGPTRQDLVITVQ
jgi:hypothetical protein